MTSTVAVQTTSDHPTARTMPASPRGEPIIRGRPMLVGVKRPAGTAPDDRILAA